MTSGIHRGFHRIGVVLAVPVLLVAGWLASHETWLQWTAKDPYADFADAPLPASASSTPWENDPIVRQAVPNRDPYAGLGTPVPSSRSDALTLGGITGPRAASKFVAYHADYTGAGLALGLALVLYAAARAIGWILDGFLSPRT